MRTMALGPRLQQRQAQGLAMTPRLQQSIRLLQMGSLELEAFVDTQLEENPLLTRGEPDGEEGAADARDEPDFRSEAAEDRLRMAEGFAAAPRSAAGFDGEAPGPEERVAATPSLRDRLERQLMLDIADPRDRLMGRAIIDALDASGWFTADLAGFACGLGALPEDAERVLLRLQQFEPAGLFARSLAECLALQLRDRGRYSPAVAALLDNLDLLAAGRLDALEKACGVDGEELARMVRELRSLDPKPASALDGEAAALPVIPDILVRAHPGGGWAVELNDEALPRVLMDRAYFTRVHGGAASDADRAFLADRLSSANWLVKALHQRAETMLKVAAELVRRQQDFFARGVRHLRPLTLRDIADEVGIHESTVSRVTANKYMASPLGLFELKYFFTAAIAGTGGEAHSAEAVRHRLKALIDAEEPGRTLSDDKLVAAMRVEGIDIARRTVAKYRETLGIPSSARRRRSKLEAVAKGH